MPAQMIVSSFEFRTIKNFLLQSELAAALSSPLLSDYHIIWKLSGTTDIPLPANVHLVSWVPQAAMLGAVSLCTRKRNRSAHFTEHPRLRLFITHGGYASIYESLYSGKVLVCSLQSFHSTLLAGAPMLVIPLMVDQFSNAFEARRLVNATIFPKTALNAAHLAHAIHKLLLDERCVQECSLNHHALMRRVQTEATRTPHGTTRAHGDRKQRIAAAGQIPAATQERLEE